MYLPRRFNLRFVFVLLTIACVVACALSPPITTTWIAIVVVASFAGAIGGPTHDRRPIYCGAVTGMTAVLSLIVTYRPLFLCKSFFRGDSLPNLENGFI